ncbi:MAG: hypothetical protein E7672_09000 [Ruminococcaceae bacterium]|nr:hypothetical protein [Oscillospiraceae bacterium]
MLTLITAGIAAVLVVLNRRELKRIVRILGVCVFLMLVSGIYPYYFGDTYAMGLTLAESMCVMLLNSSPSEILAGFDRFDVPYIGVYKTVLLVLLIIAPLFTVGITLSFFSERFTRVLYRVRSQFSDTFLFSAINERTLCIAEDISNTRKKPVIVFALRISREDIDAETLARIKAIGAYIVNDDIVHIKHSLRHVRNYYLMDTDSGENLDAGLRIYQKYNAEYTDRVNMWLYTKNEISEVIFDHLYETFNVRLINEEALIARALVNDYPLYDSVKDGKLSVLLVGAGNIGLEILRTLIMCSCLGDDVQVDINVIDLNGERAKSVFEKTSPGLVEKWNIGFYSADIKSDGFTKILAGIMPTYIVLSLGNETLNIETALYIRRMYGVHDGLPRIHVLADHKNIEKHIIPNLCVSDWKYSTEHRRFESTPICSFDIKPFGSYEDTYKGLRIGATYRDSLAVAVNATNRGITTVDEQNTAEMLTDLYNQVCFYKDYSDAFAVSVPYKLWLLGLELVNDGQGDVSILNSLLQSNMDRLRKHENKRYEAFMRSKGWTQMMPEEVTDGQLSNKLMKKHARLDVQYTDILEKMTGRDFAKEDIRSIMNLPDIIRLANTLYGEKYSVKNIRK